MAHLILEKLLSIKPKILQKLILSLKNTSLEIETNLQKSKEIALLTLQYFSLEIHIYCFADPSKLFFKNPSLYPCWSMKIIPQKVLLQKNNLEMLLHYSVHYSLSTSKNFLKKMRCW